MESNYLGYRILVLLLLTAANAFFSAAEVALLTVRPATMQALAQQGNLAAQAAMTLINNMERMISLCQVGITIASLGMGWAGEEAIYHQLLGVLQPYFAENLEFAARGIAFLLSFLLLTFVLVVIGEVVPKNLAVEKSARMALLTSPALLVCYKLLEPFVYVVERSSAAVSRLFGAKGVTHAGGHSAEEIRHIVLSSSGGQLPAFEQTAIQHLLDLRGLVAREVMVPRSSVVSIAVEASLDEVLRVMSEQNYSRLPVYRDRPENIVGVIHYRDLLRVWRQRRLAGERRRNVKPFQLEDAMRKPLIVPETKPLTELLEEFRETHSHLAVVVDEFGTVVGLVTMEDILEQVFGEIEDEHDEERRAAPAPVSDVIEVEGTIPIRDLEMQYGIELPAEAGFETLAGFLLSRFGFIPKGGESVNEGGRRYTVAAMDRNRVALVRIDKAESGASLTSGARSDTSAT
jgi:CBS domain containing-hemolysin-like protein